MDAKPRTWASVSGKVDVSRSSQSAQKTQEADGQVLVRQGIWVHQSGRQCSLLQKQGSL